MVVERLGRFSGHMPVNRPLQVAVYWLICAWFALVLWLGIGDHLAYLEDSETYRRVYENPGLEQAFVLVDNLIAATGLFFQLRRWHEQRTSAVALAALVLGVVVLIAVPMSGALVTCCG